MTQLPQSDRRRLIEALGLGPVWVRRTRTAVVDSSDVDPATLDWDALQRIVSSGRACGLADPAAVGATRPDWLVIGAPAVDDANDDAFAGRAGRLLDAMLMAIGLGRDRTVCVANLLNARSHAAGSRYLARQIELLAPRIILVVGEVAALALFPDASDFEALRGKRSSLTIGDRDIAVIATFHPARLLEDGAAKAPAWSDLCLARTTYDAMSAAAIA